MAIEGLKLEGLDSEGEEDASYDQEAQEEAADKFAAAVRDGDPAAMVSNLRLLLDLVKE